MRVSSKAHYSLRLMTTLARAHGSGPLSLAEIARVEQLPLAYLEQIAGHLRRGGLIESTRGVKGGYTLQREPAAISALDIITAAEGAIAPVDCAAPTYVAGDCQRDHDCASRSLWQRVKVSIDTMLANTTLAELVADHSLLQELILADKAPMPQEAARV